MPAVPLCHSRSFKRESIAPCHEQVIPFTGKENNDVTTSTKQDVKDLKTELTGEMKALRSELAGKIDQAIITIISSMTAIMVGLAAIMTVMKRF